MNMSAQLLIGRGHEIRVVPDAEFLQAMEHIPERMTKRLAFMSADHHTVRDFVVRELPRQHRAISPRDIAHVTGLDTGRVDAILNDLERNLFFLVRDPRGNVAWAFPVTIAPTKHRLTFSTGEHVFGA
jgi:hypothetical protein